MQKQLFSNEKKSRSAQLLILWDNIGINNKFVIGSFLILGLIVAVSITGLNGIYRLRSDLENRFLVTADIQRLVLETDRHFRKAAIFQRDFFNRYNEIGLEQAQQQYASPAVQLMRETVELSEALKELMPQLDGAEFDTEIITIYTETAESYQNIFIRAAAFISILTNASTGLEPELDHTSFEVRTLVANSPTLLSESEHLDILAREYFVARQPGAMEYVYDQTDLLRSLVDEEPHITIADRNKVLSLLDIYVAIAEEIVAIDAEIDQLQIEFDTQQANLDEISIELNNFINGEFEATRVDIRQVSQRLIWFNILSIILGIGVAYAITRLMKWSITDKIIDLTKTINAFQVGRFDTQATIRSNDEVGDLAAGFNRMASDINLLLKDLEARNVEISEANKSLSLELMERTRIQASLEKNQTILKAYARDLEQSNQELEEFAYIVSHDLRAPLRGIATLVTWLRDDYIELFDEMGIEMLDLLRLRVKRLEALIEGILEFSRVGQQETATEPVDLGELLAVTVDTLAPPEHITIDIQAGMPTIIGERIRFTQLFQNLIDNAIKYMDKPEGKIEISCKPVDDLWQICVADNGPGINQRYHEKIFQIFQTLETDEQVQSTGVGLSLVKKIIALYGGEIWVESEPGDGTRFFFTLPDNYAPKRLSDLLIVEEPLEQKEEEIDEVAVELI